DERGYEIALSRPAADAPEEASSSTAQRHQFPEQLTVSAQGAESPVRLGDPEMASLAIVLASEGTRWRVDYDGINAVATPDV
ncbi:MAG TPA: hypothetical protein VGR19_09225, partial [Allosphingosinicella sp.]|nr:hypothetical protein [Allosphingosinicella sp.]